MSESDVVLRLSYLPALHLQVEEGRHGRFVHLLLERRFSIRCVEVGGPPFLPAQRRGVEREGRRRGGKEGRNRRSGWDEGSRVEKPVGRERVVDGAQRREVVVLLRGRCGGGGEASTCRREKWRYGGRDERVSE